jgi:hypothetical protein
MTNSTNKDNISAKDKEKQDKKTIVTRRKDIRYWIHKILLRSEVSWIR